MNFKFVCEVQLRLKCSWDETVAMVFHFKHLIEEKVTLRAFDVLIKLFPSAYDRWIKEPLKNPNG